MRSMAVEIRVNSKLDNDSKDWMEFDGIHSILLKYYSNNLLLSIKKSNFAMHL